MTKVGTARVAALRAEMASRDLAAYVVPSADPHQSEYVPAPWQRRAWLTGFTGSAGMAVVTPEEALLWTDSRYWLQVEQQLESPFVLMRQGQPDVPTPIAWLEARLGDGDRTGVDPKVVTLQTWREWEERLAKVGAKLIAVDENLVDLIWKDQPPMPREPMRALGGEFAGRGHADKLAALRADLEKKGCKAHVLTALDSIAWLFNVRGGDIECNPLAISYAVVTAESAELFVDREKVTEAVAGHLGPGVDVQPYDRFAERLASLARDGGRVWVDPGATSRWVTERLATLYEESSPVVLAKAIKNDTELRGMRDCHSRDGAAVCRFLRWLEDQLERGERLDEVDCAERLEAFRAEGAHFQGVSFPSISAWGPNAAIVHYRPFKETCSEVRPEGLYLIDSGAQYLDGTTDITRTVALGATSGEQREHFTRVLQGHVAVATARFPRGTAGGALDSFARRPLWEAGLVFGHGTGHGVGHFLCVHEGPQRIAESSKVELRAGMIVSNEPGYYRPGRYGIRIENLVEVVDSGEGPDGQRFLALRELTLCPVDTRCVEAALLSGRERRWLDDYHARVRDELSPLLADPADRRWLERATEPL